MKTTLAIDTAHFDAWTTKLLASLDDIQATITNDVFYVPRLEYGSSKQAPRGMVRVSLREIQGVLAALLRKVDWNAVVQDGTVRVTMVDRVNRTADSGMQLIRDRTPIRTGRARRGWRVNEAQ